MTDDEQKKDVEAQAEEQDSSQDEGAEAAGPVAEEDSSSSQAAGEEPSSTPPAAEAEQADDAAPDAEEKADEGSAAEAEEPDAEVAAEQEKTEVPAAEKAEKPKDAIPGADLEPILVEDEERPLSAEERARKEAEAEERARREARLDGEGDDEQQTAAGRAPAKLESGTRFLATGKRKNAIARVTVLPGSGKIEVNRRPLEEFFPRPLHQTMARQPLATTGYEGNVDVRVRVHGGGISGQAGAVRHGIARALTEVDPELRGELKRRGFLTRDARVKERRKAGLKKARKRPQFSKR
jgi:small subunit ribosomal protein S9